MPVRFKVAVIQKANQMSHHPAFHDDGEPNKPTCFVTLAELPDTVTLRQARYTPRVELTIDNTEAYEAFKLGDVYLVEFTRHQAHE